MFQTAERKKGKSNQTVSKPRKIGAEWKKEKTYLESDQTLEREPMMCNDYEQRWLREG